jgi:hypothetical protein
MEFRPEVSESAAVSDDVGVRIDDGLDLFEGPGIRLRTRMNELEYLNKCQIRIENFDTGDGKSSMSEGTSVFAQGIQIQRGVSGGTERGYHRNKMLELKSGATYPSGSNPNQYGIFLEQTDNMSQISNTNDRFGMYMLCSNSGGGGDDYGIYQHPATTITGGNRFAGGVDIYTNWGPSNKRIEMDANATAGSATIECSGDIIAYSSFSDIRLKKDIEYLDQKECLDKILKLDGVNFTWINPEQPQDRQVGFIAQETEKIIPEVIKLRGNISESEPGEKRKFKKMNYDKLTPYLVEAIKEQQDMIIDLKSEIDNLKNKIGD